MRFYLREPVVIPSGVHTTGDNVDLKLMRPRDGFWLDFSDATFKNSAWTDDTGDTTEDSNAIFTYAWTPPEVYDKYVVLIVNVTSGVSYFSNFEIEVGMGTLFTVQSDAGNSSTVFKTDLTQTTTDYFKKPSFVKWLDGALVGQTQRLTATGSYNGTTKVLTVESAFTGTPANGVRGVIVNE